MTIVTIAEAREQFPELLLRVAAGEKIVIADNGQWLATLGAPPPAPPTPEEIAAAQARVKAAVVEMIRRGIAEGHSPPPDSKAWELLAEEDER